MKTMTCIELGGACDKRFQAETFEEIAKLSQQHGREMMENADEAHLLAMQKMTEQMQDPKDMQTWMEAKKQEFESM